MPRCLFCDHDNLIGVRLCSSCGAVLPESFGSDQAVEGWKEQVICQLMIMLFPSRRRGNRWSGWPTGKIERAEPSLRGISARRGKLLRNSLALRHPVHYKCLLRVNASVIEKVDGGRIPFACLSCARRQPSRPR
jgi:hypothetical protein